jgi:hypothetical protein
MTKKTKGQGVLLTCFLLCIFYAAYPQHKRDSSLNMHMLKGTHRFTLGLGHTQLSQGQIEGRTEWVPLASWNFNYDYWLSNKWGIGLQNDWILETFVVIHGNNEELERERPWVIVPVGMYKFAPRWTAIGGVGAEYAKGHALTLTRLGMEYGIHLPKNMEAGVAFVWDNRWNYFNAYAIAFTFSKIWPKKGGH